MAPNEMRLAMDPADIDIDLREVDERIIEMLEHGRCTRQHLAAELNYSGEYIYQRVTRLMEHGIVEKIHDGFYELCADGGVAEGVRKEEKTRTRGDAVALGDDLPQSVSEAGAREVVQAALEAIDADGPLQFKEIHEAVGDDYSLGYDVTNDDGAWWERVVKPGIKANGAQYQAGRGWTR